MGAKNSFHQVTLKNLEKQWVQFPNEIGDVQAQLHSTFDNIPVADIQEAVKLINLSEIKTKAQLKAELQKHHIEYEALRRQLEYYFSFKNLQKDQLFHKIISESKESCLPFDKILSCNKVKALLEKKEDRLSFVEQSVLDSTEIECIEEGVRRKDKQLPALILEKKQQNIKVILSIKSEAENSTVGWKNIEQTLKEKFPNIDINYTRKKGNTGNLGLTSLDYVEKLVSQPLEIQGENIIFQKIEGQELEQFWNEHGEHYKLCADQAGKKNKNQKKQQNNKKQNQNIKLGNKTFNNQNAAKRFIQNLMNQDGQIQEQHFDIFLDLLKRHPNGEKKLGSGAKSFEVGQHPQYPESKCLFVVHEDGTKDDFSLSKCLD